VAERMGAALTDDNDDDGYRPWSVLTDAEECCGKEEARSALAAAQVGNPHVQAFAEAAARYEAEREAPRPPYRRPLTGATYDQVKDAIARHQSGRRDIVSLYAFEHWGLSASDDDLALAAADLFTTTDDKALSLYLHLFARRPFPGSVEPLLPLVRHPDDRVMHVAFRALSQIVHPGVRALALEILADSSLHGFRRANAVNLLVRNYEAGDEILLAHLIEAADDRDECHILGMGARHLQEIHPESDPAPALLALYEYGPCSLCRNHAVEMLHDTRQLPDWMLEECYYDADPDIRAMAEGWQNAQGDRRTT
jgi:hypothetical protein